MPDKIFKSLGYTAEFAGWRINITPAETTGTLVNEGAGADDDRGDAWSTEYSAADFRALARMFDGAATLLEQDEREWRDAAPQDIGALAVGIVLDRGASEPPIGTWLIDFPMTVIEPRELKS